MGDSEVLLLTAFQTSFKRVFADVVLFSNSALSEGTLHRAP